VSRGNRGSELDLYSSRLGFTIGQSARSSEDRTSTKTIASAGDLKRLVDTQRLHLFPSRRASIVVELPWLSEDEKKHWSRVLTKHYFECGCRHGAAFLLIGSVLLLIHLALHGLHPFGIRYLLVGPLLVFLVSGLGKALGIAWSRIRLRRAVALLSDPRRNDGVVPCVPSGG
jgi:hypothetical protein